MGLLHVYLPHKDHLHKHQGLLTQVDTKDYLYRYQRLPTQAPKSTYYTVNCFKEIWPKNVVRCTVRKWRERMELSGQLSTLSQWFV